MSPIKESIYSSSLLDTSNNILKSEISKLIENYPTPCPKLKKALYYVLTNNGKGIRAALVYYVGLIFNSRMELLIKVMLAVELVHSYSLIHDDLPAMDNSNLRRGMPTCHIQFDDATAILVGDALQSLAFEILATPINSANQESSAIQLKMVKILAQSIGINGMVGGQSLDINNTIQNKLSLDELHSLKTGALITSSILLGALANIDNNLKPKEQDILTILGNSIGLAFQIIDDILDVEQETEVLGKPKFLDKQNSIPTYPDILGSTDLAYIEAEKLIDIAVNQLELLKNLNYDYDKLNNLKDLIFYILKRIS